MWSAQASPESMVTMLGRSPGHLPASLPGPSPRTSPRLCLVTRLALGQGLGGTRGWGGQPCLIRPPVAASLGDSGPAAASCHLPIRAAQREGANPSKMEAHLPQPTRLGVTWGAAEGHRSLGGPCP